MVILVVILWLGPLFEPLPKACLASVILVALKGLFLQCKDLIRLWKINTYEGVRKDLKNMKLNSFLSVSIGHLAWYFFERSPS